MSESTSSIDTSNDQFVGLQGDVVCVLFPRGRMDPVEAVRHAAWLVAMAQIADRTVDFDAVLKAVRAS